MPKLIQFFSSVLSDWSYLTLLVFTELTWSQSWLSWVLTLATLIISIVKYNSIDDEIKSANQIRVVIAGAGMSGLLAAKRLKDVGVKDIVILEASDDVGGTWYSNNYPGIACDVASHLYSYSFFPNPRWTSTFSSGDEIFRYMKDFVSHFKLAPMIKFGQRVKEVKWNEEGKTWKISTETGSDFEGDFFISAVGLLSVPQYPDIKGREDFQKPVVHTGHWDPELDLKNKRVAIIGTGASAVQVVPKIAELVEQLLVFQRTPGWIPNRAIKKYPNWLQELFEKIPWLTKAHRYQIYLFNELIYRLVIKLGHPLRNLVCRMITKEMETSLNHNQQLIENLIPKYEIGCKRITPSSPYLKAFCRDNVKLVQEPIECFNKCGLQTKDGAAHEVDIVILATGFNAFSAVTKSYKCIGREGKILSEQWGESPTAYNGISVPNFPNFFLMHSTSVGLGHNSVIFMFECQVNYILDCIRKTKAAGKKALDLKQFVLDDFVDWVKHELKGTVFTSGCDAWYTSGNKEGFHWTLWPKSTIEFWWKLYSCNERHYKYS